MQKLKSWVISYRTNHSLSFAGGAFRRRATRHISRSTRLLTAGDKGQQYQDHANDRHGSDLGAGARIRKHEQCQAHKGGDGQPRQPRPTPHAHRNVFLLGQFRVQLDIAQADDHPDHHEAAAHRAEQEVQQAFRVPILQAYRGEGEDHGQQHRIDGDAVLIGGGEDSRGVATLGQRVAEAGSGVDLGVECGEQRQYNHGLHNAYDAGNVCLGQNNRKRRFGGALRALNLRVRNQEGDHQHSAQVEDGNAPNHGTHGGGDSGGRISGLRGGDRNDLNTDYDTYELESGADFNPCLLGGEIIEVNDTAIKARMINSLGTVAVPLRWLFSTVCPGVGENVEFYLSRMKVLDKPKVMQQFI